MTLLPPATIGGPQLDTEQLLPQVSLDRPAPVDAGPVHRARWTRRGVDDPRAAILTVSTAVLAGSSIRLPPGLDAWRYAAACLPLGRDEKLFLEIVGESSFAPETRLIGNPRDRRTGVYHIRPFGWSVIECFMGDEAARMVEETGRRQALRTRRMSLPIRSDRAYAAVCIHLSLRTGAELHLVLKGTGRHPRRHPGGRRSAGVHNEGRSQVGCHARPDYRLPP
jgi:hypothetical protein